MEAKLWTIRDFDQGELKIHLICNERNARTKKTYLVFLDLNIFWFGCNFGKIYSRKTGQKSVGFGWFRLVSIEKNKFPRPILILRLVFSVVFAYFWLKFVENRRLKISQPISTISFFSVPAFRCGDRWKSRNFFSQESNSSPRERSNHTKIIKIHREKPF